jgi:metal-responsive CopG/Arc/MetJ family transcriptional regulator
MSDERMTLYLSTDLKQSIETQSERNDQSQNEWVRDAIRRKIKSERQESVLESTNAEQRLEAIAQEASEKMIESVRQYQHLMAVNASYSIVNFRVLKLLHGDLRENHIDDLFSHAHTVMNRRSEDVVPDDIGTPQQQQSNSTTRASGSRAQNQQEQQDSTENQPTPEPRPIDSDESDDDDNDLDVNDFLNK